MQLTLPPDVESYVAEKVNHGAFPTLDAAVIGLLRRCRQDEIQKEPSDEDLKVSVREGFAQIARGECEVFDRAGMKQFFRQLKVEARA